MADALHLNAHTLGLVRELDTPPVALAKPETYAAKLSGRLLQSPKPHPVLVVPDVTKYLPGAGVSQLAKAHEALTPAVVPKPV